MLRTTQIRVCVGMENQNVRTTIKSGAALVLKRKAMARGEYRKLPADPRPRACVVSKGENCRTPPRVQELFTRTFRMSSADPDDAIMSVHVDK